MLNPSTQIEIRNFRHEDMPLLGELYQSVIAKENAVFWWVGDEEYWCNVYCAFDNGQMVAKGQISIINIVPPGRSADNRHSVFINLKTVPEREEDTDLLDRVYWCLLDRAFQLKEMLPKEYGTNLCVGNDASETANNRYFLDKGYRHLNSLYRMDRDLEETIPEMKLPDGFHLSHWKMESALEEREYLSLEAEIWPDTPLGHERLTQYKQNELWTSINVRYDHTIVGGLMVWREGEQGVIEDVFVREPWRKRGIAKAMLIHALDYLQSHGLKEAYLMVLTTNESALSLYESVGFRAVREEVRYYIEL
ncbi:GNAT family N-acetyltransferase [Paenibacillus sp. DYY-L-2]|uniref:GNAT family N-acetyltransferase n=1 Tax=Paenibacillus sp. DYY-L-2 TaxID=3447013 RepID=UPI003F4FB212